VRALPAAAAAWALCWMAAAGLGALYTDSAIEPLHLQGRRHGVTDS
jgi:hypothetical protein